MRRKPADNPRSHGCDNLKSHTTLIKQFFLIFHYIYSTTSCCINRCFILQRDMSLGENVKFLQVEVYRGVYVHRFLNADFNGLIRTESNPRRKF
jgi:hypothetical protein